MSSDPVISVHNLSKEYDLGLTGRTRSLATALKERAKHPIKGSPERVRFRALDDITFDVGRGEVVGVIGKNGAGKSTLLKILSRITAPTSGYVDIVGHVGSLLEVGTGFHPELTGLENVYLNGAVLGMSRGQIDQHLDAILEFADVDEFLDTPVKRYSSGMRVRLAFSVAVHLDAEVLIVDEVLSVGDFSFQAKCRDKMRTITSEEGRTVLYVSHNLATVENLCSRALFLEAGRLQFDGPTSEAVVRYLHSFPQGERDEVPGVFNLAAADRTGIAYQWPLYQQIRLRPRGGAPSHMVGMDESLQIEIDVEGLDSDPAAMLHVIVGSANVPLLFRMNCNMQPLETRGARTQHETIVVDIPEMPLTPGEYHVEVVAYDRAGRLIDRVKQAATFTVAPVDVLGNAYHYSYADGILVVPWTWAVQPAEVARGAGR